MDLPNQGIEPGSPALQADSLPTELSGKISNLNFQHFHYALKCIIIQTGLFYFTFFSPPTLYFEIFKPTKIREKMILIAKVSQMSAAVDQSSWVIACQTINGFG